MKLIWTNKAPTEIGFYLTVNMCANPGHGLLSSPNVLNKPKLSEFLDQRTVMIRVETRYNIRTGEPYLDYLDLDSGVSLDRSCYKFFFFFFFFAGPIPVPIDPGTFTHEDIR